MKANLGGSGIILSFTDEDKPILESGGTIETRFSDCLNPTIKFHVCDIVEQEDDDFPCEPGFKIHASPPGPPDQRTSYEVWISKDVAQGLIQNEYCGTRCLYDRLEMIYWDLSK